MPYTKEQHQSGEAYLREVLGLSDDEIEELKNMPVSKEDPLGEAYLREVLGESEEEITRIGKLWEKEWEEKHRQKKKILLLPLSLSTKEALKAVKAFLKTEKNKGGGEK